MHHTITDGVNGVRMSMQYFDLTRECHRTGRRNGRVPSEAAPAPPPTPVDTVR